MTRGGGGGGGGGGVSDDRVSDIILTLFIIIHKLRNNSCPCQACIKHKPFSILYKNAINYSHFALRTLRLNIDVLSK